MGIEVAWVNERQESKQFVSDSFQVLSTLALSRWPKLTGSVCLRFIDAFGDTVFNQAQIPALLSELKSEVLAQTSSKYSGHLEKVIKLVEQAAGRTHTYVKFIGD